MEVDEESYAFDDFVIQKLNDYIISVTCALFEQSNLKVEDICMQNLKAFASSQEIMNLFIWLASDAPGTLRCSFKVSSVEPSNYLVSCVKVTAGAIDGNKGVASQIQIMSLASVGDAQGLSAESSQFSSVQQYVKYSFLPLVNVAGVGSADPNNNSQMVEVDSEKLLAVSKCMRDLDSALELFQRGDGIIRPKFDTLPDLLTVASQTNAVVLRGLLEKYNPSNVDQLLSSFTPNLLKRMGETAEQRDAFSNEVHKYAKHWPVEISKLVRLQEHPLNFELNSTLENPYCSVVEQEVNFWKEYEKVLNETKEFLSNNPAVLLTKLILKRTSRISEQLVNEAEMLLENTLTTVQACVAFTKDFAVINDIASCNSLQPQLLKLMGNILQSFMKFRFQTKHYNLSRSMKLFEIIGNAICNQLVSILKQKKVFQGSYKDFVALFKDSEETFTVWKVEYVQIKTMFKDCVQRAGKNEKVRQFAFDFEGYQTRLAAVKQFREQYDKLSSVVGDVLLSNKTEGNQNSQVLIELNDAYNFVVKSMVDIFDVSPAGDIAWAATLQSYEKRLDRVDETICKLLLESLGRCKTSDEMFNVFSVYNPLFFRATVRQAANSSRTVLIKNVRSDVLKLREKFRSRYEQSKERVAADLHDIPPLSGCIMWARQINKQLATLMKRMEDLLGNEWDTHIEGRQLKDICDELRHNLDTDTLYKDWVTQQLKSDAVMSQVSFNSRLDKLLFVIDVDSTTNLKKLRVNYDNRHVVLFKEVYYLEWLLKDLNSVHKSIPTTLKDISKKAQARFSIASLLQGSLTIFSQTKKIISPSIKDLIASYVLAVREKIEECFSDNSTSGSIKKLIVDWDSKDLPTWVQGFSQKVALFQERVIDAVKIQKLVSHHLEHLKTCEYTKEAFTKILSALQLLVDELQTKGYSNIQAWVDSVHVNIVGILSSRLSNAVENWIIAFNGTESLDDSHQKSVYPVLEFTKHEILLANQVLYVSPSIETSKAHWFAALDECVNVICSLSRLTSSKYQVFAVENTQSDVTFDCVKSNLEKGILNNAAAAIEARVSDSMNFANHWLQYQNLWDISISSVAEGLGKDVSKWMNHLQDIKQRRIAVESSDDEKIFGRIIVNYHLVQSKVNLKFDSWQKEYQSRFSDVLAEHINENYNDLVSLKGNFENMRFDSGTTKDVISGVELLRHFKSTFVNRKEFIHNLELSEKLLVKERFVLSKEWFYVANLTSVLNDVEQIYEKRNSTMEKHLPSLQTKIFEEDIAITKRVEAVQVDWEKQRPIDGSLTPSIAMQTIALIQVQIASLNDEVKRIVDAKLAVGLDNSNASFNEGILRAILEEINDLKSVWVAVSPIFEKLMALRANLLFKEGLNPPLLRKMLDGLLDELKSLPTIVRSYDAYDNIYAKISKYLTFQSLLRDICSDSLKERHWRQLIVGLSIPLVKIGNYASELTLGMIWDSSALTQKKLISEVLSTAQGEQALHVFLKDLKEYWTQCELALAVREGNVRVISGWDTLFGMLEDHLNSLASLKQSPYFRNVAEFQEDTSIWESKLTMLRSILEIWIEVQRKWMYLRGIFKNPDIKAQLPAQYSKFKSVDTEFANLLKRISQKPSVLELLLIDNLVRQLEREDSSMAVIQKALGDYLEKQRQLFPRFYFVNNDDLVEILGNANEPGKILGHLSKLFAAITGLEIRSNQDKTENIEYTLMSMISRDGEMVNLKSNIHINGKSVKDWLSELENGMIFTVASLLEDSVQFCSQVDLSNSSELVNWVAKYPAQVVGLCCQILWTVNIEKCFSNSKNDSNTYLTDALDRTVKQLQELSKVVLGNVESILRRKCEQLITAIVHQRDVIRDLSSGKAISKSDFKWLYHMRFYWNPEKSQNSVRDLFQKLSIRISNTSFHYGFEYFGIGERLVQTPLTDRCYVTLTQALHFCMGGNPFGPAGTGKTESVKMLGCELGRFVLVLNCDENFDYAAMGRIFSGLCQVGAWGCFDEFNRLEERILSAVSQQVLTIQRGLMCKSAQIELLGLPCNLHEDVGIFVTMNPGYAGRSNLPDNLKQLFRVVAMSVPDKMTIAQVMLFSQGIASAEDLSKKIVLLFTLCEEQLSTQSHYDFGLRALKSVLVGAGDLKRKAILNKKLESNEEMISIEKMVLLRSLLNNISPKLVPEDIKTFESLMHSMFPGSVLPSSDEPKLLEALQQICHAEGLEPNENFLDKVMQLRQVLEMRHGVMMVGPSGSGKSTAWQCLMKALMKTEGCKGEVHIIDPKSMKKDKLYGSLDANTLEWTDGVFTKLLRKIIENNALRTDSSKIVPKRCWIIFDGDVDPEWAENLNSVLDDNKVLTLPSGDRLKLPENVRIMLEVESLKYATMATVSRCGMVWFSEATVNIDVSLRHVLNCIKENRQLCEAGNGSFSGDSLKSRGISMSNNETSIRGKLAESLTPYFKSTHDLVGVALDFSLKKAHVMEPSAARLLNTLYTMLTRGVELMVEHYDLNPDFALNDDHLNSFGFKWLLYSLLWSFGGSMTLNGRNELGDILVSHSNVGLPSAKSKLIDFQVSVSDGAWVEWSNSVPRTELESHKVVSGTDVVVATNDTVRHTDVISAWMSSHKPVILCGPPGSGKTMTLSAVIECRPEFVLATINFSSGTTPEVILKIFAQYCEVVDSPDGLVMQPSKQSFTEEKWLVVFCDEINLPAADKYDTQRVIMFMRQLTEQGGFWRPSDSKWIRLRRIQFVGACNPPTDAGRVALSERFMRHSSLLLVDYPAESSLRQIYHCFNSAMLKLHPNLKSSCDSLTDAMIEFYKVNQEKFTVDIAPQYLYSPRELSRWVRAMYEAIEPAEVYTLQELVRLWAHEGLRLFQDRLMTCEERDWCMNKLDEIAAKFFSNVDLASALQRPILFCSWFSKTYQSTKLEDFYQFVSARLKVFYEEELDVSLVLFDDVIAHVLRIDNVLRHPMGHMLLVGESGVGKTVLTKFVAWMNGLKIFQIKANNRYTLEMFDEDLRCLIRRVVLDGEKICFIFDESNVLSSAFLERMNSLLASGEVPGLFQGEDLTQLLSASRDVFLHRDSLILDSADEITRQITKAVQRNLHVVLTMNPSSADFQSRCTTSPALFNRCVVDWFGTWSQDGVTQVAYALTKLVDTSYTVYCAPNEAKDSSLGSVLEILSKDNALAESNLQNAVVAAIVDILNSVRKLSKKSMKSTLNSFIFYVSPRDALDFLRKFVSLEQEKRSYLEEHQTRVRIGLSKLKETQEQVGKLQVEMKEKECSLKLKDIEANDKLALMIEKQKEAESRKSTAESLTLALHKQHEEIRKQRESVQSELNEAEPSLHAAKHSVQNIKKAQLDELRALPKPPNPVRLTMEAVILMISGERNTDWTEMRKLIRKEDFIATVVNFDPLQLTQKVVKIVQEEYINNPELDYASVDRASKACGPLFQWAESQIKYAAILRKIKPLRDQVEKLELESRQLEASQQQAVAEVNDLQGILEMYKAEYASAIRETELIRSEMEIVKRKVGRAESLLNSLIEEKDRWDETWNNFGIQMSTLIGDCVISAAFLTYAGIFDQSARVTLMQNWLDILDTLKIPCRANLNIVHYLSQPSQQLLWRNEYGLATDEVAVENAIVLERFSRFPLIIDPTGQALNFLTKKYASQKLIQASFLDASFLKTLASAVRFGNPLIVHDVEHVDPVLNPLLNREFQKTGGRTLVRLGNEEVDYSPKFTIVLITKNPSPRISPDLFSRVTIINFSITRASLETQTLTSILKNERPDVDKKRSEVLYLQAIQSGKLRELEDTLLGRISAVQGAILDDDSVIVALETIKKESYELNVEVGKTEELLQDLKSIAKLYEPLSVTITSIYFTLESFSKIKYYYQFSLQYYLEIIQQVFSECPPDLTAQQSVNHLSGKEIRLVGDRITILSKVLYQEIFRRILRSLRYEDKVLFALQVAILSVDQLTKQNGNFDGFTLLDAVELGCLLGNYSSSAAFSSDKLQSLKGTIGSRLRIDENTLRSIQLLSTLPVFSNLLNDFAGSVSAWELFLTASHCENNVPMDWYVAKGGLPAEFENLRKYLLQLIVIRTLRPDRIVYMADKFIAESFSLLYASNSGDDKGVFDWHSYCELDLFKMISLDSRSHMPVLLCTTETSSGQDCAGLVDVAATSVFAANNMSQTLKQVAMGSNEGYVEADKVLALAMKQDSWVLLKNIHLCSNEWLELLEKRLQAQAMSSGLAKNSLSRFRLFMTCELAGNSKIPVSLLRTCNSVIVEQSTGLKDNLQRFFSQISVERMESQPAERGRLYALLGWLNAIIQGRLRYAPYGWTKKYEFSQVDAHCGLTVIDEWVDSVVSADGGVKKAHISPDVLPWDALKRLLCETLYGGRIDNSYDYAILELLVSKIFTPAMFSGTANLISFSDENSKTFALSLPARFGREALFEWVDSLPTFNSPSWLGLPNSAEQQREKNLGLKLLSHLNFTSKYISEEAVTDYASSIEISSNVLTQAIQWLEVLPKISECSWLVDVKDCKSSVDVYIKREFTVGYNVLKMLRDNLELLISVCRGQVRSSNISRSLFSDCSSNKTPLLWRKQVYPLSSLSSNIGDNMNEFVLDLTTRIRSFSQYNDKWTRSKTVSSYIDLSSVFWVGGFFVPEAFCTATRQFAAQTFQWSLEDMELCLEFEKKTGNKDISFVVRGLQLECAIWNESMKTVEFSDMIMNCMLPDCYLRWRSVSQRGSSELIGVKTPVYLSDKRDCKVFDVTVLASGNSNFEQTWIERNVAIVIRKIGSV